MPLSGGIRHSRLPSDAEVSVRDTDAPIRSTDVEQFSPEFVAAGLMRLRDSLSDLARQLENKSRPVDEYNTCPITGAATESVLTVLPTYDFLVERIEAVLITGPPAAQITLTVGDRQWNMVIPAAGVLPIGPLGMFLGRNDPRTLTAQTPGIYTLELMGYADARFRI